MLALLPIASAYHWIALPYLPGDFFLSSTTLIPTEVICVLLLVQACVAYKLALNENAAVKGVSDCQHTPEEKMPEIQAKIIAINEAITRNHDINSDQILHKISENAPAPR